MGHVLPLLTTEGIVVIQSPTVFEGIRALRTILIHAESNTQFEDTMALTGKEDPQGQGSAITYARRYALMSILGLVADEDDDGTEAQPSRASKSTTTKRGAKTPSAESEPTTPSF